MTLLVAGLVCCLTLALGGFAVALGSTSATRVRAQTAADAAALAAMAESAAYGRGRCMEQASSFAEANGARLLEASCRPGATAVEVKVAIDDVVGEARAVLDVSLLEPARVSFSHGGLHPLLAQAVQRLVAASNSRVGVISGYRSTARQRVLWEAALRRYGSADRADDWVARPGYSMHERGLAVDLSGDLELAAALVNRLRLPLHRPLPNEPWHFELTGSRP